MADTWEYKGTTYDLSKMYEGGGALWTFAGRRDRNTGDPLMTPRMPGQGYPIGSDRLFSGVIDTAGNVREFGGES